MADEPQKKPMMEFASDGTLTDPTAVPPKKVMRTYASDLAALSGKPLPEPKAPVPVKDAETPPTPAPAPEPMLPPLKPKEPVVVELPPPPPPAPPPVRAYIPPAPRPADTWEPPQKAPRPAYSVDAEFRQPPSPPPAAYAPREEYQPLTPRAKEPGFFTRLLVMLFGGKRADSGEGRILSSNVVRRKETLTPAAPPPPLPVEAPPPLPPPPAPPPPPPPPPAPEVPAVSVAEQEREAVLARLRARVAEHEGEALPPVFPTPPPPLRREQAFQAPPPNLPGAVPDFAAPAAPPQPLQTYSSDFADKIDKERASTFAVIAADADRRTRPAPPPPRTGGSNSFMWVVASTILIVGGSTSLYLAYSYFSGNQPVAPIESPVSSLIAADEKVAVKKEDGDPYRLFRDAAELPLPNGSIRVIYYTVATTTVTGIADVPQSGTAFLYAMRLRAPDILMRNIRPDSTVGSVGSRGEAHPFFILSTGSYERSFSGMLTWERTIAQDLSILYPNYADPAVAELPADPTSTSTPPTALTPASPPSRIPNSFADEVVESYDVRVLRDNQGRALILYGYRDPNTLIIVRDEEAFAAVLTRFTGTNRE